jgi:hypothetical protein
MKAQRPLAIRWHICFNKRPSEVDPIFRAVLDMYSGEPELDVLGVCSVVLDHLEAQVDRL